MRVRRRAGLPFVRRLLCSAAVVLSLLTWGCAGGTTARGKAIRSEAPEEEVRSLTGSYRGMLSVEGQPFETRAELSQDGKFLTVRLHSPSGLDAEGVGRLAQNAVRLELEYRSECPGRLVLEGTVVDGGRRIRGELKAADCTGEAVGSFHLDRPQPR